VRADVPGAAGDENLHAFSLGIAEGRPDLRPERRGSNDFSCS
jgi:hypothetical protein